MAYDRVMWQNEPSTATPINATNLNKMDSAIASIDTKVDGLETTVSGKVDKDGSKVLSTNDYTNEDKAKLDAVPDNVATTEDVESKVFVATYGVTTAQQILAYVDGTHDPCAPILVKRGNDYYTVITTAKMADNRVIIRTFATLSGVFYIFNYDITNGSWSNSNYGVQKVLVSGTDIKTINNQSILGSGNIDVGGGSSYDDSELRGRIGDVETALDGHTVGIDVPADAVFTDTVYDDTAIASRVQAVETGLDSKADSSSIPTKTSDLTNDRGYQTATDVLTTLDGYATKNSVDHTVVTSETASADASTVTLTESNVNLKSGLAGSTSIAMPVADATQAGVINAATYQSIQKAVSDIEAMSNASVSVSGLSTTPTQGELTAAWQTAMSTTDTPSNNAKIWETDNQKGWTYFVNSSEWVLTQDGTGSTVTIDQFTNSALGTIKGSDTDGYVHAESDGTGSVNGWSGLKNAVSDLETSEASTQAAVATIQTTVQTLSTNVSSLDADKADKADVMPDDQLSLTSVKPIQNQAVANALSGIGNANEVKYTFMWNLDKKAIVIKDSVTGIEQELVLTGMASLADVGGRP